MVHATFAPVFAICLAVLTVLWARSHRFERSDWPLLQRIIERVTLRKTSTEESVYKSASVVQKMTFWVIVFLSLPLILSVVSSMFGLFGTSWQEFLLAAHRWTALVFAVVAIIHIYLVIRAQLKQ
jgi:cytochrome b subunit of formate dehydrogenase